MEDKKLWRIQARTRLRGRMALAKEEAKGSNWERTQTPSETGCRADTDLSQHNQRVKLRSLWMQEEGAAVGQGWLWSWCRG